MPAGARRRRRELAVLAHDRGGPGVLARREIEERPVEHLAQAEDAVLAVELVRARARDELRGFGRRRRIGRVEIQRLPEPDRQRALRRARGQEVGLAQAVDAREAGRVELAHEIREVLLALRGRGPRHRVVQRIRRLERRETLRVAPRAVRRVQPDRLERQAVRVDDAVALLHEQRILRRRAVELLEREAARRVGELPRRPAALHHDPVAGLEARGLGGEDPQRFATRVDAFEPGLLVPGLDAAREVEVVVDEARDDGGAGDVDDLRVRARVARDLRARAGGDDAAVVDGERLDGAEGRVDGEDLAVRDDRVAAACWASALGAVRIASRAKQAAANVRIARILSCGGPPAQPLCPSTNR